MDMRPVTALTSAAARRYSKLDIILNSTLQLQVAISFYNRIFQFYISFTMQDKNVVINIRIRKNIVWTLSEQYEHRVSCLPVKYFHLLEIYMPIYTTSLGNMGIVTYQLMTVLPGPLQYSSFFRAHNGKYILGAIMCSNSVSTSATVCNVSYEVNFFHPWFHILWRCSCWRSEFCLPFSR